MLRPFFSVDCDPARDLLRIDVGGFFTVADVEAFARELAGKRRLLRCGPNQHVTLCNTTGMKIQTREVVGAFYRIASAPADQSRRLAMIVDSSLTRLQTQRVSARASMQMFRHVADAEAWLFADDRHLTSEAA